jgi:superfamily I DNA/RNA helicase
VLIISPFKLQSRTIADALREKGLENLESVETKDGIDPSFLDGLKILLDDDRNNLGWRIVSRSLLDDLEFATLLNQTSTDAASRISEIIDTKHVEEIAETLKLLRVVQKGAKAEKEKLSKLFSRIGTDPYEMAAGHLQESINSGPRRKGNPSIRKIPVKATTIQSSKGLAADYVFITHFDDRYFIKEKNRISDQEICNFLVALTRAKKRVFLISSDKEKKPTFLTWIKKDRIEERPSRRLRPRPEAT